MRAPALFLLILLAVAARADDQRHGIFFWTLQQKEVDSLVHHVPQEDSIRLAQLKQTFKDVQCSGNDLQEQPFPAGKNLLCTLHGSTSDTILLVAHYEHQGPGKSAVENWSGATMLPFLYHALVASPRKHTFVFLEVDGEEGARSYLRSLVQTQLRALKAVVAVDALGLGTPAFYLRPNDFSSAPTEALLENTLLLAAQEKGMAAPEQEIPGKWLKIDDTKQFRFRGIPSILVHSVDRQTQDIPGSEKDTLEAINGDAYFTSYSMLCYFVANLDDTKIGKTSDASRPPSRGGRR
jgi:aminopeptidase-like protein